MSQQVTEVEETEGEPKQSNYNTRMKVEALLRRANKAHDWRVQVWAQSQQRINNVNAQLRTLGADEFVPFEPNFADAEQVEHYATMKLGG